MPKLTPEILIAAIEGFESHKRRIDDQISALRAMLPGTPAATPEAAPKTRKVSAAARRRMALGQQKRWAAIKGTGAPSASGEPTKPKRQLSAAGKAAIVAALKKRWAAKKAAAKTAPVVTKKAAVKKTIAKKAPAKKAPVKKAAKALKQAAPVAQ
ncbi:MAG: hypothetical protein ABI759_10915 [Candidatus Solibacter sp.]